MDKYEYIVNLAEKTAKRVSQNRESKISSICRLDQVCMTQERMQETLS